MRWLLERIQNLNVARFLAAHIVGSYFFFPVWAAYRDWRAAKSDPSFYLLWVVAPVATPMVGLGWAFEGSPTPPVVDLMVFASGYLLPFGYTWARIRRREIELDRAAMKCCPVCGYDLRATPDRCPECGTPAAAG